MRIDPQIAELRHEPALQRGAQDTIRSAVQAWKSLPAMTPVLQQFSRYAAGDALEALGDLHALVRSACAASEFIETWSTIHVEALRTAPLAQFPYRHSYASGLATMQLLSEHGASLALAIYEQHANPVDPASAIFSDREQHEIVVAGQAHGICSAQSEPGGKVISAPITAERGDILSLDCSREVRQWVTVSGRLVLLQLSRTPEHPKATREVRLSDGALLLQSDGDKRASQSSMAIAVLGALGREDAVPAMEGLTHSGPAHLRWEAVRQMLVLDPFRGIAALDRLASNPSDGLAAPAAELADRLRAQYPTLRKGKAA